MPISDYAFASGTLVHREESGKLYASQGEILVAKPDPKGIDSSLWAVLKIAADSLRLVLFVNSITTGKHVPASRHYSGRAADINHLGAMDGPLLPVTLANAHALALVAFLRQSGWQTHEGGPFPGLMLGPPNTALNQTGVDHSTHLHVSIPTRPLLGATPDETSDEADDCELDE